MLNSNTKHEIKKWCDWWWWRGGRNHFLVVKCIFDIVLNTSVGLHGIKKHHFYFYSNESNQQTNMTLAWLFETLHSFSFARAHSPSRLMVRKLHHGVVHCSKTINKCLSLDSMRSFSSHYYKLKRTAAGQMLHCIELPSLWDLRSTKYHAKKHYSGTASGIAVFKINVVKIGRNICHVYACNSAITRIKIRLHLFLLVVSGCPG